MKPALAMPAVFWSAVEFELRRIDYAAPEAGGRLSGVQAGFPLWTGTWTIDVSGPDEADAARAFMAAIRGSTRRFLGRDVLRSYPKAHKFGFAGMVRAGGGAFDGSATTWSETIDANDDSLVTLTNLPVGLTLAPGDYIGFRWAATEAAIAGLTWHAPVRVVSGGVANGAGAVTVTSEPPVPSAVPAGAVAYLNEPKCTMVLDAAKSSLQPVGRAGLMGGGQIVGVQDIRA